jgi:probable HAF family extracellular repeat protein
VSDPSANLGTLFGGDSFAWGINDSGQVTGYSSSPDRTGVHAFRTSPTGTLSDPGADLGTLPGYANSRGTAINALGQVTGYSGPGNGEVHAFRTTPTGLISDPGTALGALPGLANSIGNGINALGVVVGTSYGNANVGAGHAFIYDTQMRDLNDLIPPGSGWVLTSGTGINDFGLIAGFGQLNGQGHAFVLTPVPEPGALALAGLAAVSWAIRRKWVRRAPAEV